jgi:uncharacterized protein (TIRG00374 family)
LEVTSVSSVRSARARAAALRTALGLLAGLLLVFVFLRLVNVGAVYHRLTHLEIGFGLLCGVAFLGAYVVRAMRWRWLLRPCEVSVGRVIAIYQVATFLNWLLPIRGGEIAKALLLRRTDGVPVSRSLATVSMDKVMDLLPAGLLLAVLPFVHLRLSRPLWALLLFALGIVVVAAATVALAAWRREHALRLLTRPLVAVLPPRAAARVAPFIAHFLDALLSTIRRPRVILVAAAYTAAAVSLDALFCTLAFRAVGVTISLPVVLYGYTLYNLVFILPTPPGQVGSNELIGLLIFAGLFGVTHSGVGAMFLFSHPWTAVLMTCSGLVSLSVMGLTLRSTWRMAQDQAEWVDT